MDLRIFCTLVVVCIQVSGAAQSTELPANMVDQLLLLREGARKRFIENCFQFGTCDRKEVYSFDWISSGAAVTGKERLWFTYKCTRLNKKKECPVDGAWSRWEPWGACEDGCGVALKTRYRNCTNPEPLRGGFTCAGQATQTTTCYNAFKKCEHPVDDDVLERAHDVLRSFHEKEPYLRMMCMNSRCSYAQVQEVLTPDTLVDEYWTNLQCAKHLHGCQVDGEWGEWAPWSECSSECGKGHAFRYRACDNPVPLHGGAWCNRTAATESETCYSSACEQISGSMLSPWSDWTSCSATCGIGSWESRRRCVNAPTCDTGNGSVAEIVRAQPCVNPVCDRQGEWSDWAEWSACSAFCGGGVRYRARSCNNPLPIGEGNECEGDAYAQEDCTHEGVVCKENTKKPKTPWGDWSQCSRSCGHGHRDRYRKCTEDKEVCYGSLHEREPCGEEVLCPVDGGWSEWTAWTPCSETCEGGSKERYRTCSSPFAINNGTDCQGESDEEAECATHQCPTPIGPSWGSWAEWGVCSTDCGGGTMTRERQCMEHSTQVERNRCFGEYGQTSRCNYHRCNVTGGWTEYSDWSECSSTCGDGGVRIRDRTCSNPAPEGYGHSCAGIGTDVEHCIITPCRTMQDPVYTFRGDSYISYYRFGHPTKHALIYISFYTEQDIGLLLLMREGPFAKSFVSVYLKEGNVVLFARTGSANVHLTSKARIKTEQWNQLEIGISMSEAWIRLNDGPATESSFPKDMPHETDWDSMTYLGGASVNLIPTEVMEDASVGFDGQISNFRVNYRAMSMASSTKGLNGAGVPHLVMNVEEDLSGDIEAQLSPFRGASYVPVHVPSRSDNRTHVQLKMKATDPSGLVFASFGKATDSMLAFFVVDRIPRVYINYGNELMETSAGSIQLNEWFVVDISVIGPRVTIHLNDNVKVAEMTSPNLNVVFNPREMMSVGGASQVDCSILSIAIPGVEHIVSSFEGFIYSVDINGHKVLLENNAMVVQDTTLNSAAATLGGYFQEIREPKGSSIVLQCRYQNFVDQSGKEPIVKWLKGHTILEAGDHFEIKTAESEISECHLHKLNSKLEGLYACELQLEDRSLVVRAFGVSMFDATYYDLDPNIILPLVLIIVLVVLFIGLVALITTSFSANLRKRSTVLQGVHTIVGGCCSGIGDKIKDMRDPRRKILRDIGQTYDSFTKRVADAEARAKRGSLNEDLLMDITATYDSFIKRIREARDLPEIDPGHLEEINQTYEKFMQRMARDKKKDVLQEISEVYGNKRRQALLSDIRETDRGNKISKNLLRDIDATYESFTQRVEDAEARAKKGVLDDSVLQDINATYDSFLKRIREARELPDINAGHLKEINETYEKFMQRMMRDKKKDVLEEVTDAYGSKRRKALLSDIRDTNREMKVSTNLLQEIDATYDNFVQRVTDAEARAKKGALDDGVLQEINATYDNFLKRIREARELPDLDPSHLAEINQTYEKFIQRMSRDKKQDVLSEIEEVYGKKRRQALMSEIRDTDQEAKIAKIEVMAEIKGKYDELKMEEEMKGEMKDVKADVMAEVRASGADEEENKNYNRSAAYTSRPILQKRPSVKELAKKLSSSLTLRPMTSSHLTSTLTNLSDYSRADISDISLPDLSDLSDLSDITLNTNNLSAPTLQPEVTLEASRDSPLVVHSEPLSSNESTEPTVKDVPREPYFRIPPKESHDYEVRDLTPFVTSTTTLETAAPDRPNNNNNLALGKSFSRSATNLFTKRGNEGGATSLLYAAVNREQSPLPESCLSDSDET